MEGRIVIGLPISPKRMIHMDLVAWLMNEALPLDCQPVWAYTPSPEMGRNAIVEGQLKDRSVGAILFLDYDVVPPLGTILSLMAMDKPIAAACVPIRVHGVVSWNVSTNLDHGYLSMLPDAPFKAHVCGFGCVLVQRAAFEATCWPWFRTLYKPMGEDGKCILRSEDEFFCIQAGANDMETWVNPALRCKHWNQTELSEVCHEI